MMSLGIFGGTFNPIHLGHLVLAETARESLALDRVVFIPTHQPPHKRARDLLSGSVRMKLVELAIRDHPAFVTSDIELERQGPSYSIETVKILHTQLPQAKLFLLIGADMLAVRWVAWDELKRLCTIVVAHRAGAFPPRRETRGVRWLKMAQVEISSSDIRARLLAGRSIRYRVPYAVERFIGQQRLYQSVPGAKNREEAG
jgi:nicotinate-nucleotide adenylyltransferase